MPFRVLALLTVVSLTLNLSARRQTALAFRFCARPGDGCSRDGRSQIGSAGAGQREDQAVD